jgi:hypothetical protein
VRVLKGIYHVQCFDAYDGELGEVYDVSWDGKRLRYCVYWASSGRFAKNSILRLTASQVELTYTFTDAEQSLPPYGEPASRQLLTHLPRHGFPYGSPPVKRDVGKDEGTP